MKRLMVANVQSKGRYSKENIITNLKAQIDNMIELEWNKKDIILVSNFDFEFMGVSANNIELNKHCLTGSKMFALLWIFENLINDNIIWSQDLDCWQNYKFDPPEIKDVGIATYSNPKLNGGSVFWRYPAAKDIINIITTIISKGENKEEPTLNKILKSSTVRDRVTIINSTYNVGCSGYKERGQRAEKPILVSHMNPLSRIAWEIHRLNRKNTGIVSVSERLDSLLRKYYILA